MCRFILQKVALFFVTLTYTQLPLPKYEPFKINSCRLVFLVEVTCILLFLVPSPRKDLSSNDLRTTYISGNSLPREASALDHSTRRVAQVFHALSKSTVELESYYTGLRFTTPSHPKTAQLKTPSQLPPSAGSLGSNPFRSDTPIFPKLLHERRLVPSTPSKAVFNGTIVRNEGKAKYNVVIKFTLHTYCDSCLQFDSSFLKKHTHDFLFTCGARHNRHAPQPSTLGSRGDCDAFGAHVYARIPGRIS